MQFFSKNGPPPGAGDDICRLTTRFMMQPHFYNFSLSKILFPLPFGLLLLLALSGPACQPSRSTAPAGQWLLLTNGRFFTADPQHPQASSVLIHNGRIVGIDGSCTTPECAAAQPQVVDLQGAFAMPGFIEGHGHFSSLGRSLQNLNLLTTKSWADVVRLVGEKAGTAVPGAWIEGRGWHQEKWVTSPGRTVNGYPFHDSLTLVSPANPVLLYHASGHGLFANAKAMELAGISRETPDPVGGRIVRDVQGRLTGVFEENAMNLIEKPFEAWKKQRPEAERVAAFERTIALATQECLAKGITSFQDAGSDFWELAQYRRLAESGQMGLRLWAMIAQPKVSDYSKLAQFPQIGLGDGFFTCRAVKAYLDGALGSYGAWLLAPYTDKPDSYGQNTTPIDSITALAAECRRQHLQYCVHAIGDRANREVLNVFEQTFRQYPATTEEAQKFGFQADAGQPGFRWRIEHAQHVDPADQPRFAQLGVIASMQAIHCTSDAPFVIKRLGFARAQTGAYAWRRLLDQGARLSNGTDAPVEDVDPLACLYAAVSRRRADGSDAFFPENCLTREEALRSYTRWNAYAAFEEAVKGSIEVGKYADFVVLSTNLLECPPEEILQAKVLRTYVHGQQKYSR